MNTIPGQASEAYQYFVLVGWLTITFAAAVLLSTSSNPSSFDDFKFGGQDLYAVPFSTQSGEGVYCLPINIQSLGLADLKDGANVTLQVIFNGDDGALYQVRPSFASSLKRKLTPLHL